ncbi:MAG: OsmC family protein [Pyrinomonadaceae bacterium]
MATAHKTHSYKIHVTWTGNLGEGTSSYKSYARLHEISGDGKQIITCSSDPAFRGDKSRYNPEELLVASLSGCHMLSYLHLCANSQMVVTGYVDNAVGTMAQTEDGGGHFTEVVLKPVVTIKEGSDSKLASELHEKAHELCFIANSVNFSVRVESSIEFAHM